ncbi:MAG: hypothetical protein KW804_01825 [Candidatus Doudnabacteria bacterium]|nr:hypothetical protein [Candidatus Doudnabacteria bacterium]
MNMNEELIEKILQSIAKTKMPDFNSDRIRNQILDRIAIPVESGFMTRASAFAPFLRLGAGVMASLLIVVSLTLGVAVAALDSVPGSSIYPLKKIVENIQLKLTPSDEKSALQLKFASNRVDELQEVLEQKQEGKISAEEADKIIVSTVKDIQKTTAAAVNNNPRSKTVVNKLADISNKLKAASVQTEGQVKIDLEKALEDTKISQEEAIKNLEKAGLKVEASPLTISDTITASGKLTAVTIDSASIGTAKFLLTKDTKFVGLEAKDLKAGMLVDIKGEIKDNKSYALQITKVAELKTETVVPDTTEVTP